MKKYCVTRFIIMLVLVFSLLPIRTVSAQAQAPEPDFTRDTLYVPGEVVVGFDRDLPQAEMEARAEALAGSVGAMVVDQYANVVLLSADPEADVFSLAERLAGQTDVAFAEPNYLSWIPEADPLGDPIQLTEVTQQVGYSTLTRNVEVLKSLRSIRGSVKPTYPDDEYNNWGNTKIKHDIIWNYPDKSSRVCVIDTGADNRHPDLRGKIINGYDFVNDDRIANDDNGHGTHVAGTIAAKAGNGIGPAGISTGKVLMVKALNAQGWGTNFDVVAAINYCAKNKSSVIINMSLESSVGTEAQYYALNYAINYMNKVVIVAAGSQSTNTPPYPAGWALDDQIGKGLLSVGALRAPTDDRIWVDLNGDDLQTEDEIYPAEDCATDFTNYGDWVEMIAPGESIYSTLPVSYPFWNNYYGESASGYDYWDGTSMAAAHVSGAAAREGAKHYGSLSWMMKRGSKPVIAEDPDIPDPANGYSNTGYGYVDENTIKAPFCWPSSMSGARGVDLANTMLRGGLIVRVIDATTGLPLVGATITVRHRNTGATLAVGKVTSKATPYVDLLNIPTGLSHPIYVNAKGYTAGRVIVTLAKASASPDGYALISPIAVPPKAGTSIVATWKSGYDLDLFAFLPAGAPSGVVGSGKSGHPNDLGAGTLLDYPYARWYRNGGAEDSMSLEVINLRNYLQTEYPYYLGEYSNGTYEFFLHDYNNGADLKAAYPSVKIWIDGRMYYSIYVYHSCNPGNSWAGVTTVTRKGGSSVYWEFNECGTSDLWPYAEGNAILSASRDWQPQQSLSNVP